jgi:hypothetical protein
MAIEVKSIVGEDLMHAAAKDRVVLLLRQLRLSPHQKRFLFARWCLLVNCKATLADLDQVAKLGG